MPTNASPATPKIFCPFKSISPRASLTVCQLSDVKASVLDVSHTWLGLYVPLSIMVRPRNPFWFINISWFVALITLFFEVSRAELIKSLTALFMPLLTYSPHFAPSNLTLEPALIASPNKSLNVYSPESSLYLLPNTREKFVGSSSCTFSSRSTGLTYTASSFSMLITQPSSNC